MPGRNTTVRVAAASPTPSFSAVIGRCQLRPISQSRVGPSVTAATLSSMPMRTGSATAIEGIIVSRVPNTKTIPMTSSSTNIATARTRVRPIATALCMPSRPPPDHDYSPSAAMPEWLASPGPAA
jgi:hypothetical protein